MKNPNKVLSIGIAQMSITGDAIQNGKTIRALMHQAAQKNVRLVQFPEGALSGYAKNPIQSWDEVNWEDVRNELEKIMALAKKLRVWVVLGSAHPLTPPRWPHNSLYVISDEGMLTTRYDKRICSHTETTKFYTRGTEAITFEVDGFKFGCLICVEINFPSLFIEYSELEIDCLLLSSYPIDKVFYTKAQAHAGIHNIWLSLAVPTECKELMPSALVGPNGQIVSEFTDSQGVLVQKLDASVPDYEISLKRARPWRKKALDEFNKKQSVLDSRSLNRSCL